MAKKLKFFDTEQEVIDYLTRELLDTLRGDLSHCTGRDEADTRRDLKAKIHDIESIEDRLTVSDPKKEKLSYDLAEALNDAYSTEMDRKDESRNFEHSTLAYWKGLIGQSITFWPRREQ